MIYGWQISHKETSAGHKNHKLYALIISAYNDKFHY